MHPLSLLLTSRAKLWRKCTSCLDGVKVVMSRRCDTWCRGSGFDVDDTLTLIVGAGARAEKAIWKIALAWKSSRRLHCKLMGNRWDGVARCKLFFQSLATALDLKPLRVCSSREIIVAFEKCAVVSWSASPLGTWQVIYQVIARDCGGWRCH